MAKLLADSGSRLFKTQVRAKEILIGKFPAENANINVNNIRFECLETIALNDAPSWMYNGVITTDPSTWRFLKSILPGVIGNGKIPSLGECLYRLTVKDTTGYISPGGKPLRELILEDSALLDRLTLLTYLREEGWIIGFDTLATLQFLSKLPVVQHQETDHCTICGEGFADSGELPVRLPCNHVFGSECTMKWLSPFVKDRHTSCPMCRNHLFDKSKVPWSSQYQSLSVTTAFAAIDAPSTTEHERCAVVWTRIEEQLRDIKYALHNAAASNPHVTRLTRSDVRDISRAFGAVSLESTEVAGAGKASGGAGKFLDRTALRLIAVADDDRDLPMDMGE